MIISGHFSEAKSGDVDELLDVKLSLGNSVLAAIQTRGRGRHEIIVSIGDEIEKGHSFKQQAELVEHTTSILLDKDFGETGNRNDRRVQAQDVLMGLSHVCQAHSLLIAGQIIDNVPPKKGGRSFDAKMAAIVSGVLEKQEAASQDYNLDSFLYIRNYANHIRFNNVLGLVRDRVAQKNPELRDFLTNAMRREPTLSKNNTAEIVPIVALKT